MGFLALAATPVDLARIPPEYPRVSVTVVESLMRPQGSSLRLLVVDDHPVVCDGVSLLLSRGSNIEVVGNAERGRDAVLAAAQLRPDVVLLDLRLPDADPPRLVSQLLSAAPGCRVLLFTAHADVAAVQACLEVGAAGCLLKDVGTAELINAVHTVVSGRRVVDPRLGRRPDLGLRERLDVLSMTRREFEVVRLVATGMSNPEIAQELGLARNTVKTYLQSAMQKLGARNRVEAIGKAHEARLL